MAKTQIKNYVFKPGIGALDNRYPDAYSLLESNKTFIQKESTAWIQRQVDNGGTFTPTDASYIPATGVLELTIGAHSLQEGDVVFIAEEGITFTCALDGDATEHAYPRATGSNYPGGADPAYNAPLFITSVTATTITINVGISSDTSVHTFVSAVTDSVTGGYPGYTYNVSKCERDVGYVIDSYLYDLRYGGNQKTKNSIKYYWDEDVAQIDGDRTPELGTHRFIGNLITGNIFANTLYTPDNTDVSQTVDTDKSVANLAFTPSAATFTPATGEMTLTIADHGLSVGDEIFIAPESIVFTCALDGNATEHAYPRRNGVPNDTGKDPFYYAPLTITAVTTGVITVNVGISSDTSRHTFVRAGTGSVTSGAYAKINTLVFNTVDVITNGLTSMPTLVPTGVGTVRVQGGYSTDELLLITNTTKNEIIYSFNTNATGGSVELKTDSVIVDTDFPKYLNATDAVTTITLNYDTSSHSATDDIQIFVEKTENGKSVTTTRPYDFGTDAIERMRVAQPMSMLDADFEYGLQPTKWAAIGTLRGYPSVYEIPGSDTPVVSVVTDASAGTEGVGQSLITVTTLGPHGFLVGDPITIKALEDSISGAARGEGSFIIVNVPSETTFTFYAKSKVGTTEGEILSTTYTQLRKAGFYTGANIGTPLITVDTNGSAGTLVMELGVESGNTLLPYDGPSPSIGAPLTNNASITTGSQVTSVVDQSQGGGTYITPAVEGNVTNGATSATVSSASGVVPNLAVDRGDGIATFVSNVDGNTINFTDPFVADLVGNNVSYVDVPSNNDTSIGTGATFDITVSGTSYTLDAINNPGSDYQIGDRILMLGDQLGGESPLHDATILVTSVFSDGAIDGATIEGTAFDGTATITDVAGTYNHGNGSGSTFDVTWLNGSYTTVDVTSPDLGTGYVVNDIIKVPGDQIYPSFGATPQNDLFITVTGVGAGGAITSVTFDGTAPDVITDYTTVPYTTSGAGIDAVFDVTSDSGSYTLTVQVAGADFLPGDTVTVLGTELGGATPANDLTITIDNVGGSGEIVSSSTSGVAYNGSSAVFVAGDNFVGSGALFDIDLSGGTYTATITNPGTQYGAGQEIVISGGELVGLSPTNDLTITINTVDDLVTGVITTITESGTAAAGGGSYTNIFGSNDDNVGVGALFDINKAFEIYSGISLSNTGTGYKPGNRLIVPGTDLGGASPLNDIRVSVIAIDEADGSILNFESDYDEAAPGVNFDLICTVGISEQTVGEISAGETADFEALATLDVEFPNAHGLVPGASFIVAVQSDDGVNNHNLASGSYIATGIPEINKLQFQARAPGTIDTSVDDIQGAVYPRPDSFFIHRPYDGGVQLGTGGPQHGAQAIRQSKKYIRYQSGKGIMYTTGALFAPSYDLRSVTAEDVEVGSEITVVTDDNDHGVQVGGIVRLLGITTPGYNSGPETRTPPQFDYTVTEVVDERTFKVRSQRRLGSTTAELGFAAQMSVVAWHGATVRSGIFDDQNGIFWEFDGTQISVVQRTGTKQLAGTIAMQVDNNLITGTNTRFREQIKAGDRIIIKGMTHVVSHVISQTECTVTPDWRGVTDIVGTKANLINDKKVKQTNFNLDRLDGTGPSGYNLDIAKMQMIGIQYSWYGAGFIDFMLRGANGDFVYAHRMRNSNINTEAFMRSGNLPVRYEVTNEGPPGKLAQDLTSDAEVLYLEDTSFFPHSGYLYIDNEVIQFTGKDDTFNKLTGLIRGSSYTNFQAGASRTYEAGTPEVHSANTGVILISQTITPLISHWGSAFITDGMFDDDRGYIFSYAETGLEVSLERQTAFMIRLAPSVSNALVGDLGERELLNRAQLLLQGIEITSDGDDGAGNLIQGGIVVEGILNPQNYPVDPGSVSWQELSGLAQGGQPSFAQIASGGAISWTTDDTAVTAQATAQADLSTTIALRYSRSNSNIMYFRQDQWESSGARVGDFVTASSGGANFSGGIRIRRVQGPYGGGDSTNRYYYVTLDSGYSGTTSGNATVERRTTLSDRNFAYMTTASFDTTTAAVGTTVTSGGTVSFPAATLVSDIDTETFGGTTYYVISFNNAFSGTLAQNTGTVEFEFKQPPYGQPGETVFSFIAVPGERSTTSLAELKELTNTPLGGRGTYPNGPDVLAINIYKVAGAATNANIILKWGEAQA